MIYPISHVKNTEISVHTVHQNFNLPLLHKNIYKHSVYLEKDTVLSDKTSLVSKFRLVIMTIET